MLTHVYEIGTGTHLKRYYVSDRYEYELEPITPTERLYLGGDAYSAPMVLQRTGMNGTWVLYNIGRDYLGSITEIVNNDNTSSAYHYRYDPWGKLIHYSRVQPFLLGRGYTGHEQLVWFGLINANARLYDPLLGRFLSPDPYVQDPDFTQNYNRFSYCLNNPLKYTDESGEFLTWKISTNEIRFGYNFGFWGFGIIISFGNQMQLGAYTEEGFRFGGTIMGAGVEFAATAEQSVLFDVESGAATASMSFNFSATVGIITAYTGVSYSGNATDDVGKGKLTISGSVSTSFFNQSFGLSGGYVYTYDYKTDKKEASISAGISWKNPTHSNIDSKISGSVKYSFKDYHEGEKWYNHLSASLSWDATNNHNSSKHNGNDHYKDFNNGWYINEIKKTSSITDYWAMYQWSYRTRENILFDIFEINKKHKK